MVIPVEKRDRLFSEYEEKGVNQLGVFGEGKRETPHGDFPALKITRRRSSAQKIRCTVRGKCVEEVWHRFVGSHNREHCKNEVPSSQ